VAPSGRHLTPEILLSRELSVSGRKEHLCKGGKEPRSEIGGSGLGLLPALKREEAGLQVGLYCGLGTHFLHPFTQDVELLAFSFLKIKCRCSSNQLECEIN